MLHFLFSPLAACSFERYRLALNSPETDVQEVVYDVTDVETSQAGNFYKLTNIPKHPMFDVSALPGIIGSIYHCVRKDERNERICGGQITRFSFVDQCSSEGPFKRGLRNFAWTVKSKIRKSLSAPSFGCVQLDPRGVQRLSLGKKKELLRTFL